MTSNLPRRAFLKWLSVGTAGVAVAACAPAGAPAPTTAEEEAAQGAEQAVAEAEVPTLELWSMGFEPHKWMMEAVIAQLGDIDPGYAVDYQAQPGDYGSKWRAAIAAGEAPDTFIMHGSAILELAIANQLLPVTPTVMDVNEFKEKFMPETYLQSFYNGNNYCIGVPDPPGDAGLVVNLAHLEEAGLEHLNVFESREQMLDYGRTLTVREGDDVLRAGLMYTGDGNNPIYWLSYIMDLGGRWFDNGSQRFTVTTPEAEQTLQFFHDIVWEERLDDPALGNNSSDALAQELAAMAFKWPEFVPFANKAYPGLQLAFIVKPSYVEGKPAIFNHSDTWNLVAWAGTPNPDAVLEFLSYCSTKEVQRAMLEQNPGISPLKEINFDPEETFFQTGKGAYLAPVLDAIKAGQFRYFGPFGNMDTLEYSIMWPVINQMLQRELSVQEALQEMEAKLNEEMALYQERYSNLDPVEIYWDGIPADLMKGIPVEG